MATVTLARLRAAPLGMTALLVLAAMLYVALLIAGATPLEGDEAAYSQAWGALLLHPISGVAAFVAVDAASRHIEGALGIVALLPPLIAFYALWARLPSLRAIAPGGIVAAAVWGAVALLSAAAFATGF